MTDEPSERATDEGAGVTRGVFAERLTRVLEALRADSARAATAALRRIGSA